MLNRRQRIFSRSGAQSNGHKTYGIGVPWEIAELVPGDTEFHAELVSSGILLRPVCDPAPVVPDDLPEWCARRNGAAIPNLGRDR
jgi:hypothetical protein